MHFTPGSERKLVNGDSASLSGAQGMTEPPKMEWLEKQANLFVMDERGGWRLAVPKEPLTIARRFNAGNSLELPKSRRDGRCFKQNDELRRKQGVVLSAVPLGLVPPLAMTRR
jgi:hypothetical protein